MQSGIDETLKTKKLNVMINFDAVTGGNTQEQWPHCLIFLVIHKGYC